MTTTTMLRQLLLLLLLSAFDLFSSWSEANHDVIAPRLVRNHFQSKFSNEGALAPHRNNHLFGRKHAKVSVPKPSHQNHLSILSLRGGHGQRPTTYDHLYNLGYSFFGAGIVEVFRPKLILKNRGKTDTKNADPLHVHLVVGCGILRTSRC